MNGRLPITVQLKGQVETRLQERGCLGYFRYSSLVFLEAVLKLDKLLHEEPSA